MEMTHFGAFSSHVYVLFMSNRFRENVPIRTKIVKATEAYSFDCLYTGEKTSRKKIKTDVHI
jgi:hypothetical protein